MHAGLEFERRAGGWAADVAIYRPCTRVQAGGRSRETNGEITYEYLIATVLGRTRVGEIHTPEYVVGVNYSINLNPGTDRYSGLHRQTLRSGYTSGHRLIDIVRACTLHHCVSKR